ncbi:DEAD/DEAH box helicase [Streptomyces sp. NPDC007856]|uniref:DEAD/DEAH box helicase n=1 Tax=Streptomyces sp. NPDC007856 TaxID=3364781 RepID=UPI00369E0018
MTVSKAAIDKLSEHWAVAALGPDRIRTATSLASRLYVERNVGSFIHGAQVAESEDEIVRRAALAYEMVAAEGIPSLFRVQRGVTDEQAKISEAAAYKAFELRRSLPLEDTDLRDFTYQILQLGSLAYTADRWAEFRAWLRDRDVNPEQLPGVTEDWEGEILRTLAEIWIRLLRKEGWADLTAVCQSVVRLRELQSENEESYLAAAHGDGTAKPKAWRLISLYHWARSSELLAQYLMQGTPVSIRAELDYHFERAIEAAETALDAPSEVTLRWLHLLATRMTAGSLWALAAAGGETRKLVEEKTRNSLFEFLPPQRSALLEQGLLDQASTAVVVDLPTSAGKTVLAEFKIVQALGQFHLDRGWVAYVAPTRALVSQITRRLRKDLGPLNLRVEQLSAAVELDDIEQRMVSDTSAPFDVLVATPEKLHLLIRNSSVHRPLSLLILDEAQNIEDKTRGVRIELLLATVKQDCPSANFLLLMPYVPNADDLARWLSPESGKSISLGATAWQPNDRMIGLVKVADPPGSNRRAWTLNYKTLLTSADTLVVDQLMQIGSSAPLDLTHSKVKSNLGLIAAAAARAMCARGTSIVMASTIPNAWSIARTLSESFTEQEVSENVALVQRFLATEVSPDFELIGLLKSGIGVHHAGLSDEARSMMEWLAETGELKILVATTGIAQGLNFPVSSLFIANRQIPYKDHQEEMPMRSFWNLVGRAGRVDHDSIGVVGLACRDNGADELDLSRYVQHAAGSLASRLVTLLKDLSANGLLLQLDNMIYSEQWADFRSYVAHLYNQSASLDEVLSKAELLLRNTFGYTSLSEGGTVEQQQGRALLKATRTYAESLSEHPENARLADSTGFAPESVRSAAIELRRIDGGLSLEDWKPQSLFRNGPDSSLPELMGVLMKVDQVKDDIEALAPGRADGGTRAAEIAADWVNGVSIKEIAERYFQKTGSDAVTKSLSEACKLIYKNLATAGTWGLSALSKMPTSGLNFDEMAPDDARQVNLLGAMLYHGVSTEGGVIMRMASAPRSVAESLGSSLLSRSDVVPNAGQAREFLSSLPASDWESHRPAGAAMSGEDYRRAWQVLSGEPIDR